MSPVPGTLTRRSMLHSLLGIASASALPALDASRRRASAATPASERVTVGVIGLGARGFNLLDDLLAESDAEIVAVCDVHRSHFRDRPPGKGPALGLEPARQKVNAAYGHSAPGGVATTGDFREICGRDDIDAVVVATPDHWHALCTLAAISAGKAVYCEKPITHLFHEGQRVYRQAEKHGTVFQTGSQQRSDPLFRRAVNLVRSGTLGTVAAIEVGLPPGYDRPQDDVKPAQPPADLDYDFWCGPAAVLPYMRARHHRWWRGSRAFGGGVLMDWIGHHNDIAHWAIGFGSLGPESVEAQGWQMPATPIYDTPWHYQIDCRYANGTQSTISDALPLGVKFIGDAGWLFVSRGKITASDRRWLEANFPMERTIDEAAPTHMRDFLNGVKQRRACVAPAQEAHRSITPGHLGYISHALGRRLRWDAENEMIADDPQANGLLHAVEYRAPWRLSGV